MKGVVGSFYPRLIALGVALGGCGTDPAPVPGPSSADGAGEAGQGGTAGSARSGNGGTGATGGDTPTDGGSAGEDAGGEGGGDAVEAGRGGGGSAGGGKGGAGNGGAGNGGAGNGGAGTAGAGGECSEVCYTGADGTLGVGICRAGTQRCLPGGTWSGCSAEVTPSAEACNGEDDDCDGSPDDGFAPFECGVGACRTTVTACSGGAVQRCVPLAPTATSDACNGIDDDCDGAVDEDCAACIPVAPTGDDASAIASNGTTPFRNVQAAIDFADTHRSVATRVCVAAGPSCGASAVYTLPGSAPLRMRSGIDVLGGYRSSDFTRCTDSMTQLAPGSGQGVLFASDVVAPTVLDGFTIDRFAAAVTSAVTVDGATAVMLSNLTITDVPAATSALYGVNVINGGDATVFRSTVHARAPDAVTEAVAVRAVGARVSLEDSCDVFDQERCRAAIGLPPSCPSGRSIQVDGHLGTFTAVLLENAPGSRVERSSVCTGGNRATSILVTGDATGTVLRANGIATAAGATEQGAFGIFVADCGGATPWVVDNASIQSSQFAIAVRGDCRPVIDSNTLIEGFSWPETSSAIGIECVGAPCVISGNADIGTREATTHSAIYEQTGIRCSEGCGRISDNVVLGGSSYRARAFGVKLERTGPLLDRNVISASFGNGGIGIQANDAWSRIENNFIQGRQGGTCSQVFCPLTDGIVAGIQALGVPGGRELDVHSNHIESGTLGRLGWNHSVLVGGASLTPGDALGVFRNNILAGMGTGGCIGLFMEGGARPRVFEHNDINPVSYPALAATGSLGFSPTYTAVDPNAIPGVLSFGNRTDGVLVDTGTPAGAPALDYDRNPRDALPDIGPWEAP